MRGYGYGPYFGEDKPIRFDYGTVADGFGNEWPKCSDNCRIEIVRPGKAQCDCANCDWPRCKCDEQQACPPRIREMSSHDPLPKE